MVKHDIYAQYKESSQELFNETIKEYKSFIKLKFGLVLDKNKELKEHKKFAKKQNRTYLIGQTHKIIHLSGALTNYKDLQNYTNKLPKYSFVIWSKFKLQAPYFSKDDDEFYIIQNPILKETNFKVPMVRGSNWKGALANAFKNLIKDGKVSIESFLRIFGAGSESIKTIESYLSEKSKNLKQAREKLIEFILFELGLKIDKKLIDRIGKIHNKDDFINVLEGEIFKKAEKQQKLPKELKTHRGRAIFYPTYFDRLSLEIINPHDRRKRAGTNPIHYEVVPPGTEGILQIIYIPFDGVLESESKLRKQVEKDLSNLCKAIERLQERGIGAKTKLGWGRFSLETKKCFLNFNEEDKENLRKEIDGWEIVGS